MIGEGKPCDLRGEIQTILEDALKRHTSDGMMVLTHRQIATIQTNEIMALLTEKVK